MRVLLSGAIGAAVAAAAWKALEHFTQADLGWLVCLVGLVTGISVHRASGADAGSSFARGALAIILTLAAIAGGQQVYAKIMQANSTSASAMAGVAVKAETADTEEDTEGDSEATDVIVPEVTDEAIGSGNLGYSKSSMKKNFSEWDMVWMSLAALAAYVTGKGGDKASAVVVTEDRPEEAAEQPETTKEEEA